MFRKKAGILSHECWRCSVSEIDQDFAFLVRSHRQERKLSLRALGQISGVSYSTIGRIERADFVPTLETAMKLSGVLGFNVDDLIAIGRVARSEPITEGAIVVEQVVIKRQFINSRRRKNISKIAQKYKYVIIVSGVLKLITGSASGHKFRSGARLSCSILSAETCWALAMTDVDLIWFS